MGDPVTTAVGAAMATAGAAVGEAAGTVGSAIGSAASGLGSMALGGLESMGGLLGDVMSGGVGAVAQKGAEAVGGAIGKLGTGAAEAAAPAGVEPAAAAASPMAASAQVMEPSAAAASPVAQAYNNVAWYEHMGNGVKEGFNNGGFLSGHVRFSDAIKDAEGNTEWGKSLSKWSGEAAGKLLSDTGKVIDGAAALQGSGGGRRLVAEDSRLPQMQVDDTPGESAAAKMARFYAMSKKGN